MREPGQAAAIVAAMVKAVKIPVTVKMRKGWDDQALNAPAVARQVQDAGASAIASHGRTAKQSYSGVADWELVAAVAEAITIPVFGSGDCVEPRQIVERLEQGVSGVFVGRGVLRNPWILAQAQDILAGRSPRDVSSEERGQFLLDYIDLLQHERVQEPAGFRHVAPGSDQGPMRHDRWVINKLRALCTWYTKGLDGGSHLRIAVNAAGSIGELRDLIHNFFVAGMDVRGTVAVSHE
jgi:tRNA-dihydrouridine synthase B